MIHIHLFPASAGLDLAPGLQVYITFTIDYQARSALPT
jgi:hypothetical protein